MRIISGRYRGRHITPGKNFKARPTTDFAKESLFNILGNNFEFDGLAVLDLFSGTGSISYEFASRNAAEVYSVELNPQYQKFIAGVAKELDFKNLTPIRGNAFIFLKSCYKKFDIIFADPPYSLEGIETIPDLVFEKELLHPGGWLIVEHSAGTDMKKHPKFISLKKYGQVHFSIFEM